MRMFAALAGLVVLAAGVSLGDTNEALAQATPPTRVFGTVTVDGQTPPEGTTVEAFIGTQRCGTGEVRALGDPIGVGFLVDVDSETFSAGCGNDGETITFVVGGVPALETATFQTGAFVRQDLTATGQPATPAPSPTSTPSPSPGTPSPTPTGTASPTPAPSPTGTPSPTATVTPEASPTGTATATPTGTATGTPSATPEPTASPTATPTPIATTVRPEEEDGASDGGGVSPVVWTLLAVVVLAAGGLGVFLYQRSRGPTPP